MSHYGGWAPYVPVDERRRRAEREVAKLAKKGQAISPVKISGKRIASTFWGVAWCDNLESYQDLQNRLPRGRTYARNGSVLDLQIDACEIRALVSGSSLYHVSVRIGALPKARWQSTCKDCIGGIDSLVELLQGRFSKAVMARICQQGKGLFPNTSEIKFTCSCPDYASMCKHVAAALYGVGTRLDEQPDLLFRLRAVDPRELVANLDKALPLLKTRPDATKVLVEDDISALFGLDMAVEDGPIMPLPKVPKSAPKNDRQVLTADSKKVAGRKVAPAKAVKSWAKPPARPGTTAPKIATKMWKIPPSPASIRISLAPSGSTTGKVGVPKPAAEPVPAVRQTTKAKTKALGQATTPQTGMPPRAVRSRAAR
jgi:uncharacterized Zn finger protein